MTYQLPTDADGVKYHGREYDDKGGIIAAGVDEHGNDKPILINTDGSLNMQSVVQELSDIKQRQQEILDRLDDPIDTRVTGSIIEKLNKGESEHGRITLEPSETIRIIDNEVKTNPNILSFFRTSIPDAKVRFSLITRTEERKDYAWVERIDVEEGSNFKRVYIEKDRSGLVYLVEITNTSTNTIEVFNTSIYEVI